MLEVSENSEMLQLKKFKNVNIDHGLNENTQKVSTKEPPDGGIRAYMVVLGSFLTNGLLFGIINSYSVIYKVYQNQLKENGVPNFQSRASLVGSLTMGVTFLLSPISGVLTGLLGLRGTAVLGGSIATIGLLSSSFVLSNVDALCFTYGVLYGLGASFAYTPSLAILGHYFKKYLGIVNGIVTIGSSIFTVIMASLMEYMINTHGLEWMFRLLALLSIGIALCGLLFAPIPLSDIEKPLKSKSFKSLMKTVVQIKIWKVKKYRLWAMSMPVALFGYLVPYVHLGEFIHSNFPDLETHFVNVPLQCIAITSGVGRLIFGYLADKPGIDRILLQQISFYFIGTLTIILPFVQSFGLVIAVSLGMGLFDGAFIALIGPIAIELCGTAYAAQAIGCMLGMTAFPLSMGPPIAAMIFKVNQSYKLSFILAGLSPLVGATLMFAVRFSKREAKTVADNTNGCITSLSVERKESNHEGHQ